MKNKLVKRLFATLLIGTMVFTVGCTGNTDTQTVIDSAEDTATIEVNQNDFRGGTKRIDAIKENVRNIVTAYNEQNFLIEDEYPCSYWNSEEYQYFISHCIDSDIYYEMSLCNEFETDWTMVSDTIAGLFKDSEGNLPREYSLQRVTDNHYQLKYLEENVMVNWRKRAGDMLWTYDCVYNPTHDWLQEVKYATSKTGTDTTLYQQQFLEYGRLGNTFIIQTENERLYVVYENTEPLTVENTSMYIVNDKGKEIPVTQEDIDSGAVDIADVQYHTNSVVTYNPLRNNKIKAFYYSKLDGEKLPEYGNIAVDNFAETDGLNTVYVPDEAIDYDMVTPDGAIRNQYSLADSIFLHINDINEDWVTEKGTYAQVIAYENGDLTVTTQNRLSRQYEVFNFYADGTVSNYLKPMEVIETTTIPLDDASAEETVEETAQEETVSYNLFNIEQNTGKLGTNTLNGKKITLPLSESDLTGMDFTIDNADTYNVNNKDVFFSGCKATLGDMSAETTEGGYEYVYTASLDGNVNAIIIKKDGIDTMDVSLCGIKLGDSLESVQKALGDGTPVADGLAYFDGKGYFLVHCADMKDGDTIYSGVDEMSYYTLDYKKMVYEE